MRHWKILSIYLVATLIGLLLGEMAFVYQPVKRKYEITVKVAIFKGRPVEALNDLGPLLRSPSILRTALGSDSDFVRFSNEIGKDGNHEFQIKSAKSVSVVTLSLDRQYFYSGADDQYMGDYLFRVATDLAKRHNNLLDSNKTAQIERMRLYDSFRKPATIIMLDEDSFEQKAEVIGQVGLRDARLLRRIICHFILIVVAISLTRWLLIWSGNKK